MASPSSCSKAFRQVSPRTCFDMIMEDEALPSHQMVLLLGSEGVGKSALTDRFGQGEAARVPKDYFATPGPAFHVRKVRADGTFYLVQLLDCGAATLREVPDLYPHLLQPADGVIFMYDVTNRESFNTLRASLDAAKQYRAAGSVAILLGNKLDRASTDRKVAHDEGKALAEVLGIPFMEVSMLEGLQRIWDTLYKHGQVEELGWTEGSDVQAELKKHILVEQIEQEESHILTRTTAVKFVDEEASRIPTPTASIRFDDEVGDDETKRRPPVRRSSMSKTGISSRLAAWQQDHGRSPRSSCSSTSGSTELIGQLASLGNKLSCATASSSLSQEPLLHPKPRSVEPNGTPPAVSPQMANGSKSPPAQKPREPRQDHGTSPRRSNCRQLPAHDSSTSSSTERIGHLAIPGKKLSCATSSSSLSNEPLLHPKLRSVEPNGTPFAVAPQMATRSKSPPAQKPQEPRQAEPLPRRGRRAVEKTSAASTPILGHLGFARKAEASRAPSCSNAERTDLQTPDMPQESATESTPQHFGTRALDTESPISFAISSVIASMSAIPSSPCCGNAMPGSVLLPLAGGVGKPENAEQRQPSVTPSASTVASTPLSQFTQAPVAASSPRILSPVRRPRNTTPAPVARVYTAGDPAAFTPARKTHTGVLQDTWRITAATSRRQHTGSVCVAPPGHAPIRQPQAVPVPLPSATMRLQRLSTPVPCFQLPQHRSPGMVAPCVKQHGGVASHGVRL